MEAEIWITEEGGTLQFTWGFKKNRAFSLEMRNHELINNTGLIFEVLKVSDIRIAHRINC
jgi:hypothetical protein